MIPLIFLSDLLMTPSVGQIKKIKNTLIKHVPTRSIENSFEIVFLKIKKIKHIITGTNQIQKIPLRNIWILF